MRPTKLALTIASLASAAALTQPAAALTPLPAQTHMPAPLIMAAADQGKLNATKATLRDLWVGHVFWVRNVVVAALAADDNAEKAAEQQIVANAQAIADSIEPFYGAEANKQFFALLAGHYGAIKTYLDASVANDEAKQSEATTLLLNNATEIASFLSSANPNLSKDAVEGLLQAHGGHHVAQIQQLQAKDYAAEAQTWTDMTQHIYVIADATADALAQQFVEKF
jgi:hypothetical protein